jgi:hypothetical protein
MIEMRWDDSKDNTDPKSYFTNTMYLDGKSITAITTVECKEIRDTYYSNKLLFHVWHFTVYFQGNNKTFYYLDKQVAESWQQCCLNHLRVNSP